jgi:S1-C subfamily serine protease
MTVIFRVAYRSCALSRCPILVIVLGQSLLVTSARADTLSAADQKLYQVHILSAALTISGRDDIDAGDVVALQRFGIQPVGASQLKMGSGFILDKKRKLIITNSHCVGPSDRAVIFFPGYLGSQVIKDRDFYQRSGFASKAKLVARNDGIDLAVLQVESLPPACRAVELAEGGPIPGESVFTIGNPGASRERWVFRSGEVVRNAHELHPTRDLSNPKSKPRRVECQIISVTVDCEPGMSGSPLFNTHGKLVGVLFSIPKPKSKSGYAIEIRELKSLLKDHGFVPKIAAASPARASTGAQLTEESAGTVPSGHSKSATSPEAVKDQGAKKALANLRPDPVHETPEQTAARKLKLAIMMADGGINDKARARFQEIITNFSDTEAAKTARQWLEKLSK